jgi:hypothetical protein
MPKLVLLSEGFTGQTCDLKSERTTIGRLEDNAFPIAQASVSSHHCEVLLRGSDVVVKDLNSTNGTFVNGEKVSEVVIKPGQILRLGQVEMRLETGAPQTAADKKKLDHTMVIPQGVKRDELEAGGRPVALDKSTGFQKKSDRTNMVFIAVGIILGIVIVGFLVYALFLQGKSPQ